MATVEQLRLDIEELSLLQEKASRPRVKDIIGLDIRKLQTEIVRKQEQEQKATGLTKEGVVEKEAGDAPKAVSSAGASASIRITKDIKTYAWDQSDKFMKIYATDLKGIQNLPKESVTSEFSDSSFKLLIRDLDGKDYKLHVAGLFDKIQPSECYHKVKSDMVVVLLRKANEKTWAYVTQQEKKAKEKNVPTPKTDDSKDPEAGLMDLMKKMYDEGDDEMKRTIAKAWTESREKKAGGLNMDI